MSTYKRLAVTLVHSPNRRKVNHKACVLGLGLRRLNQTVEVEATPCNLGMINQVSYLLAIKELEPSSCN